MKEHLRALGFAGSALVIALLWVMVWTWVGADRVKAGENVLAVFPPFQKPWEVLRSLERAPVRQFEPLPIGNAWIVQASDMGLAGALKASGAILVLQVKGPLHFALGCTVAGPLRGEASRSRS